jgi:hypothetical protein
MPSPRDSETFNPDLPPIVFYTGLTGTKLWATLDKKNGFLGSSLYGCGGWNCACSSDIYEIYGGMVGMEQMTLSAQCWLENFALNYDLKTKQLNPVPGVNISTLNGKSGFSPNMIGSGGIGPPPPPATKSTPFDWCPVENEEEHGGAAAQGLWTTIQNKLIQGYGYSMSQMRSVVWDWRLGPNEWLATENTHGLYEVGNFAATTKMIEELSKKFGKKVLVFTISEGGTIFKNMLDVQSQEWKDQFIEGWFSYSSVFAGASDMALSQMSGIALYPKMIAQLVARFTKNIITNFQPFTANEYRKMSESFPGTAVTAPIPTHNATANEMVLYETPAKNYTFNEYVTALEDAGLAVTAEVMKSIEHTRPNLDNPGVKTWCWYGVNFPTPGRFKYDFNFNGTYNPKQPTEIININGDGTVHEASLRVCDAWAAGHPDQVIAEAFDGQAFCDAVSGGHCDWKKDAPFSTWHVGLASTDVTYTRLDAAFKGILGADKYANALNVGKGLVASYESDIGEWTTQYNSSSSS